MPRGKGTTRHVGGCPAEETGENMSDRRSIEDRQMDALLDVLDGIREALVGIRGALHPCEYVHEYKDHDDPCDCRADRMVGDSWYCEMHAVKVEEADKGSTAT
jgi:hypothetical protein